MSDIKKLQHLAGIVTEGLTQHSYTFYIIDPNSGEFTKYYSGSIISIMQQLKRDPENNMIFDVLQSANLADAGLEKVDGTISFKHDDHIFAFIPN